MTSTRVFPSTTGLSASQTRPTKKKFIEIKKTGTRHTLKHHKTVKCSKEALTDVCGDFFLYKGPVKTHLQKNPPRNVYIKGPIVDARAISKEGLIYYFSTPRNAIPPTTTQEAWQQKMDAAKDQCWVDVGFWGGVIPGNCEELRKMVSSGICGFKCFLIHSGVDEFPSVSYKEVELALQQLVDTNSVLLFHAECDVGPTIADSDPPEKYSTFLASRPSRMEELAIEQVIRLCETYKVRCHIVHLSASSALPMIREAQGRGVPLSVETCHHYLSFAAHQIPDSSAQYKCCPPIRDQDNQELLWGAVKDGTIQQVVSDHSPCTPDLKMPGTMDFMQAWGGIASLQFGLSLFWSGASKRGYSMQDAVRLLCEAPASQASLSHRKASLRPGMDADFVIWNPQESFTVEESMILHKTRAQVTPYLGQTLQGKVYKTVLHGEVIYEDGKLLHGIPIGGFL
ncbi:unnamed protein product, partial [Meganyctiphanes norvegica]